MNYRLHTWVHDPLSPEGGFVISTEISAETYGQLTGFGLNHVCRLHRNQKGSLRRLDFFPDATLIVEKDEEFWYILCV